MPSPKLDALQRQSSVERLFGKDASLPLQSPAAVAPVEPDDEPPLLRKSYCILRGFRKPLTKLRLVSRQGEAALVDYSSVTWVNLRLSGELVLRVSDGEPYTITIRGRGLGGELLDALQNERVEWIRELDDLVAAAVLREDSDQPMVTGIHIAEGSVSREWSRAGTAQP